jgi:hypothetical protein
MSGSYFAAGKKEWKSNNTDTQPIMRVEKKRLVKRKAASPFLFWGLVSKWLHDFLRQEGMKGEWMFKGAVKFMAIIKGNGLTFPLVEYNPNQPGVDKVEIEAPNGDAIYTTVHLAFVASHDEGRALATRTNMVALNRISFYHSLAIENSRIIGDQFSLLNPPPGILDAATGDYAVLSDQARLVIGITAAQLKMELEQPTSPAENNFGLFRSARQSISPVEEFMHLYHILLMIYNDKQADVDSFIVSEDPAVPQTQAPLKSHGVMETVYTRLRNELAHKRHGVNLEKTKSEMANWLGGLIGLTKRAIELNF